MAQGLGEFRAVVEQHQSMVFSIAVRVVRDEGLAEEVAQDVFLALYRSVAMLETEEHVVRWLRRVATHRAIDAVRRRAGRPEAKAEEFQEELGGTGAATAFAGGNWLAQANSRAHLLLASKVELLMGSMPEVLRAVLTLRYQEEMEPKEIADLMAMPEATVKSHLQRGMQLMRRKAEVVLKEYARG